MFLSVGARPESHRAVLRQGQAPAAQSRRANRRSRLGRHRSVALRLHPNRMRQLLRKRWIRLNLNSSRSKSELRSSRPRRFAGGEGSDNTAVITRGSGYDDLRYGRAIDLMTDYSPRRAAFHRGLELLAEFGEFVGGDIADRPVVQSAVAPAPDVEALN